MRRDRVEDATGKRGSHHEAAPRGAPSLEFTRAGRGQERRACAVCVSHAGPARSPGARVCCGGRGL